MSSSTFGHRAVIIVTILSSMSHAQSESFGPFAVVIEQPATFGAPPPRDQRPEVLRAAPTFGVEVRGQVFRPANPDAKSPLPVVLFLHGFAGQPSAYGVLMYHLASWGFLCVAVEDRSVAPRQNPHTQALLAWSLARNIVDDGEALMRFGAHPASDGWAVVGHSMGAVGAFYLGVAEPRVETIVSISPYDGVTLSPIGGICPVIHHGIANGWQAAREALLSFSGTVHLLAGTDDTLTPAASAESWFGVSGDGTAQHSRLVVLGGMGHVAALDHALTDAPLGVNVCDAIVPVGAMYGPDQHRMVRKFVGATLRRRVLGHLDVDVEISAPNFNGTVVFDRVLGSGLADVRLFESP